MLNAFSQWFRHSPRRLVLLGLWLLFPGALLMLAGAVAQAASLQLPLVPDSALGFTASASLVCWGVWALGAGLRLRSGAPSTVPQGSPRRG